MTSVMIDRDPVLHISCMQATRMYANEERRMPRLALMLQGTYQVTWHFALFVRTAHRVS